MEHSHLMDEDRYPTRCNDLFSHYWFPAISDSSLEIDCIEDGVYPLNRVWLLIEKEGNEIEYTSIVSILLLPSLWSPTSHFYTWFITHIYTPWIEEGVHEEWRVDSFHREQR